MNNYCIYMHKNKVNNKKYIGQTCQKPEYRWNYGNGYKECPYFYNAIQKYGWDNFQHIILETNLNLEEANKKEKEYIQKYQTTNSNFGYNISLGGNDSTSVSKITKQKLSQSMRKRWKNENVRNKMSNIMKEKWKDPQYRQKCLEGRKKSLDKIHQQGKTSFLTEEGRKRISEARKKYIIEHGTPTQGKGHSQATRKKLSEQKKGAKNPMYGKKLTEYQIQKIKENFSKKVKCLETGVIFESRKAAADWCGLKNGSSISAYLYGKKKSAGKHPETGIKLHWENVD